MLGELRTWSPIRSVLQETNPFRQDIDQLFERFFGEDSFALDVPMLPAVESFIEDGKLCMRFDLPGVDPKDIDISIAGDTVTVRASREQRSNQGDGHFKRTEDAVKTLIMNGRIPPSTRVNMDQLARALQGDRYGPHFNGNMSWAPYAIVVVGSFAIAGLSWYVGTKRKNS